jgi:ubiquinone/menaquinone biosynthesis C-methylase UbiE
MPDARISQGHISDLYRKIAPRYDLWARMTESKARDRCLEIAAIQDGESVLEVAVGTGLAFERILKANPSGRNEGIDLTEAMLNRAPDNDFDVLINNYMFDLLPEDDFQIVLAEFRRVLRPGGRLVLVNMTKGKRWYNSIWEWVYRMNPAWLGGCRGVQVSPFLGQIGFVTLGRQYISQMTFPSEVICAVAE